jgi:hypothetical protein
MTISSFGDGEWNCENVDRAATVAILCMASGPSRVSIMGLHASRFTTWPGDAKMPRLFCQQTLAQRWRHW